MAFRGFDVTQIHALAGDLGKVSGSALGVHRAVAAVLTEAQGLLKGKPATTDPLLAPLVGQEDPRGPLLPNPFGPGIPIGPLHLPGALEPELSAMAGSMKRRCRQLEAAKDLIDQGYRIDSTMLFLDEKAANEKNVTKAIDAMKGLDGKEFGSNGNRDDLEKVAKTLDGLTAAELDAFFDKVPAADLKRYNDLVNDTDSGWMTFWQDNGLPEGDRRDHFSRILARVGPTHWDKVKAAFPSVQPGFTTTDVYLDGQNSQSGEKSAGIKWGMPTDPMFKDGVSGNDVGQGTFADCWYIASLAATAQADPKFIQEGLKQNPNGTVDVRIWDKDGKFHWVTVTPDLPVDESGSPVSAYGNGETWPAYYEKAFALMYAGDKGGAPDGRDGDDRYDRAERGSYGATEWDFNEKAPPYLTGKDSEGIDNDLGDIKNAFESGRPVIVSTGSGDGMDEKGKQLWGDTFSTRHVYYVKGFKDGKILLGNPWGSNYATIEATPEQYKEFFGDPQALQVPK
ncbi:C2 family cysteine protease [Streptomyces sp. NPDC018031]|uniref:C2 family cysteine protease n=1 Tax=Streptomyces sp. NPDC018031 TaxID=3365033 RepID=UPI0037A2DB1C